MLKSVMVESGLSETVENLVQRAGTLSFLRSMWIRRRCAGGIRARHAAKDNQNGYNFESPEKLALLMPHVGLSGSYNGGFKFHNRA
jgi:hypothetical protein